MVVIVSGVSDPLKKAFVSQEITELFKGTPGASISTEYRGDLMYCQFTSVDDPRAFADRIYFGEVTKLEGGIIEVTARAPTVGKPTDFADRIIRDLKSPLQQLRTDALNRLASAPKSDGAADVAVALVGLLGDPEPVTRRLAAKALIAWGSRDDSIPLAKALGVEPDQNVRREILRAIETFADPRVAKLVAARLKSDPNQAGAALVAMGAAAEDDVLIQLSNNAATVRAAACRVLQAIGTRKSIAPLQRLALRNDGQIDGDAALLALKVLGVEDRNRSPVKGRSAPARRKM